MVTIEQNIHRILRLYPMVLNILDIQRNWRKKLIPYICLLNSAFVRIFWIFLLGLIYQNVSSVTKVCSVAKSCLTFVTPWTAACQTSLSFTVLGVAQTHVHWVDNAIQPCHPLFSPSPPALSLSQHEGSFPVSWLLTSSGQSIGASASVLPMNILGWFPLGLTDLISLLSKELWSAFSSTIVQKHQFFGAQPSLWSNSHIRI